MDKLTEKAKLIKLVAFDVDGVLTNGDITYTASGEEIKSFNAKDGQGMNMLRSANLITAIITARKSPIVERRAKDLDITYVYQGVKHKIIALQEIMIKHSLSFEQIAYVGDDLPDLCILEKVGLAFCPLDAVAQVKKVCHYVASKQGGKGAVREITDFILQSQDIKVKMHH